jgi:Ca2+/Na+ antiporter
VTFLALANGAPDIIMALSATSDSLGPSGFYLGLSSILGSCMFDSSVGAAIVVLANKDAIKVTSNCITRDILFLILSMSLIFYSIFVVH